MFESEMFHVSAICASRVNFSSILVQSINLTWWENITTLVHVYISKDVALSTLSQHCICTAAVITFSLGNTCTTQNLEVPIFLVHIPRQHAEVVARAVVGACRLEERQELIHLVVAIIDGWQSPVQPQLLHTLFNRLLGQDLDFEKIEPLSPAEVAGTLSSALERQAWSVNLLVLPQS